MIRTPLVSVVLPTFNRAKTLERAISSVLNQTFRDIELIIIDDGSTDESSLILRKYADLGNVRLISSSRRGCSAARNLGVAASVGTFIAFQDSDDEWVATKLEAAVSALTTAGRDAGIFYSDMTMVQENGSSIAHKSPDIRRDGFINDVTLDYQVVGIGIQSAVIRRECFDQVGLFDEALPRFIDLDLFIRLSDNFEFIHYHEPLVKYFATDGISRNTQALVTARRYLINKYRRRLRLRKHYLAGQYILLARALYENDNEYQGSVRAAYAILISPRHPRICRDALTMLETHGRTRLRKLITAQKKLFR